MHGICGVVLFCCGSGLAEMSKPEFDRFADNYDHVLNGAMPRGFRADSYYADYKVELAASLLGVDKPRLVLDFGCGSGRSLSRLAEMFPDAIIFGYDPSAASLAVAAKRAPAARLFSDWDALSAYQFDLIFAANVFHHIEPSSRPGALLACRSALSCNGSLMLFEHNPLNPLTRRVFERCPFDEGAQMLTLKSAIRLANDAGFNIAGCGYTLFFPYFLAWLRPLEPFIKRLPVGAQYYVHMVNS